MRYHVAFHPSWWHDRIGIDFSESFWTDPQTRIAADVQMRRHLYDQFGQFGLGEKDSQPRPLLGSDLLACGYLPDQILGCQVRFAPDDSPQVVCAQLDEDACFALEAPDFDQNPIWQDTQRQINWLLDHYGHIESHINLCGVQNLALDLRGQELFLDYYDEESPAQHLLEVCYQTVRELCRRLYALTPHISGGVSNIVEQVLPQVLLHSNCSVEMVSEATYIEQLLPYDCRLAEEFPVYGIHHCGQTMEHVVGGYAKVPNLRFAEVGAGSDLEKVARVLPESVLLNARYSPVKLATVSDADLYAELKEMTRIVPGSRLSISCAGIDKSVPDHRIAQFCAYCKELLV